MEPLTPHLPRRELLKWAGVGALGWLTPLGHLLARQAEQAKGRAPAQSVIFLWMGGGPSQLETFDPHPGTDIAAGTRAIDTAVKGVQLAEGFEQLAGQIASVSLVRSLFSKEGDHERGTYLMKTGYRPDPTVVHPSIGAICCHALPAGNVDIPRHVSILPGQWPARGGFLGDDYDAFKAGDPADKVPDVTPLVPLKEFDERLKDLEVVERTFAKGRSRRVEATQHHETMARARRMMTSEQLAAFDVKREPAAVRKAYGDTAFGRGCLAARRLIEVGVRCVEVTLDGWDTHADNHALTKKLVAILDPAFAALIADLKQRDLLKKTVVICAGEFGRTPEVNRLGGRDHWPHNFCVALAGGGVAGGRVIGRTDPQGGKKIAEAVPAANLHATVLAACGIDHEKMMQTPIRRTVRRSEGEPIKGLLV
jgi:uncharacterized protein (DUF1501 family)